MQIWVTSSMAREYGCTHKARIFGIVPGFIEPETALWVSRSDLLAPIEGALAFFWATLRQMRGEEPDFMFEVGPEIN